MANKLLKQMVNGLLKSAGVELRRISNSNEGDPIFGTARHGMTEELLHMKRLGFQPDLIIDAGAANGDSPFLSVFPSSKFVWIEPCQEFEKDLISLQKRFNGEYHIAVAGAEPGTSYIEVYDGFYGSTIMSSVDGHPTSKEKRPVPMIRVDQLVTPNANSSILLKADTQGSELEVLKGAINLFPNVELILLEVCLFHFYDNGPDFLDICNWLKTHGFMPYSFVNFSNRPLDKALFMIDVFFVQTEGKFRKTHQWASPKQYADWANKKA
jgi:FkbM family methyltransferase